MKHIWPNIMRNLAMKHVLSYDPYENFLKSSGYVKKIVVDIFGLAVSLE